MGLCVLITIFLVIFRTKHMVQVHHKDFNEEKCKHCNLSFFISTEQFPDLLKVSKIIPIHTSGLKDNPANNRPISILSIISIVIEKHITKHLYAYLNKYSLSHKSKSR